MCERTNALRSVPAGKEISGTFSQTGRWHRIFALAAMSFPFLMRAPCALTVFFLFCPLADNARASLQQISSSRTFLGSELRQALIQVERGPRFCEAIDLGGAPLKEKAPPLAHNVPR